MIPFLMALLFLICAFLVMIVLLQRGRGGGLAGAFGSGGGTSSAFGTKTGDVFTIVTVVAFVLFMLISIALSFQFKNRNRAYVNIPAEPSELTLVGSTPTSVQLSWKDNSKDEAGFTVNRQTGGAGDWVRLALDAAANATGFTDTTVTAGTKYSYRVTAFNEAGESKASNEVTGTTPTTMPTTMPASTSTKPAVERLGSAPAAGPGATSVMAPAATGTAPAGSQPVGTTTAPRL